MEYVPCVATRNNGRPCRGAGIAFDPERGGMVCDAHTPPHLDTPQNRRKRARMEAGRWRAREASAEHERFLQTLTEQACWQMLEEIRQLSQGRPLSRKVRALLEGVLSVDHMLARTNSRTSKVNPDEAE